MGRLWTLCNVFEPEQGFCLSIAQGREIWLRYKEDQGHFKRLSIDAIAAQDRAIALMEGEATGRKQAILGGVLGGVAALLTGVGVGFLIDRFLPRTP